MTSDDERRLAKLLDEVADDERAVMDDAARLDDAPGLDQVDAILTAAMDEPSRRGLPRWPLAAAAMLVAATAFLMLRGDDPAGPGPGPGIELGRGVMLLAPTPDDDRIEALEWSSEHGDDVTFDILVTAAIDDGSHRELLSRKRVAGRRLPIPAEEGTAWPNGVPITVRITARDATGSPRGSDSVTFSLSR